LGRMVVDLRDPSLSGSWSELPSSSWIPRDSPLDLARLWHERPVCCRTGVTACGHAYPAPRW
jgi:hypothetical protein